MVVRIPKGSYHFVFEPRQVESHPQSVPLLEVPAPGPSVQTVPAQWRIAVITLLACLIVSLAMLGSLLWTHKQADAAPSVVSARPATGPLAEFWRPFTSGGGGPWVIFSNAAFIARPAIAMRFYKLLQDSKTSVYDHYTGVGEVLAVHSLDEVFATLGRRIRVKRGSLFSLDDIGRASCRERV